jgi:toxin ParE1/3/4
LDLLASSPRIGHEIRDDVRAHPHRSHIIVYREDGGKLEVLMVRHGRSNWRKYL